VIVYFLSIDAWLRRIAASTLFLLRCTSNGNDPLSLNYKFST
jgi:hypothetical protein